MCYVASKMRFRCAYASNTRPPIGNSYIYKAKAASEIAHNAQRATTVEARVGIQETTRASKLVQPAKASRVARAARVVRKHPVKAAVGAAAGPTY